MSLDFEHRFAAATVARPPLLLLHGTGGDETDLLPLGQALAPGAALLSPRGRVLEGGMPRFFRRFAEGVFEPAEVRARADELARFVAQARHLYGIASPVAVGFSNGANVAAVMMARHPGVLAGAILLRPMLVLSDEASPQPGTPVLMVSGRADPIVPPGSAEALAALLSKGGAVVRHGSVAAGHGLTQDDLSIARDWLAALPA